MSLSEVRKRLDESVSLGVKEYYFTGGEPFINPEMTEILETTLSYGPATVLTNATVLKQEWLQRLRKAEEESTYCLEFRVSLDGFSPETNDPIRGDGTFERAMQGVRKLVLAGFLPIITAVRTWDLERDNEVIDQFVNTLKSNGYTRPRLKILPTLQIGAEADRTRGYLQLERITPEMMDGFDRTQLVCHNSRIVTDRGVHICPILIESPDSLMGDQLQDSMRSFPLVHGACFTCYQYGSICSNPTGGTSSSSPQRDVQRKLAK